MMRTCYAAALLALALTTGCHKRDGVEPKEEQTPRDEVEKIERPREKPTLDVRYVPTEDVVLDKMLEVANVTERDVVYDLGCGDGRIVIAAARRFGCKGVGYDLDPERIADCEANKAKETPRVRGLLTFVEANVIGLDVRGATVIMIYMLRDLNEKLIPALKKMKPGSRIVANVYPIPRATPDEGFPISVKKKSGYEAEVYRYTTPLQVEE